MCLDIVDENTNLIINNLTDMNIRKIASEKKITGFDYYILIKKEILITGIIYSYDKELEEIKVFLKNSKIDDNLIYFNKYNELITFLDKM